MAMDRLSRLEDLEAKILQVTDDGEADESPGPTPEWTPDRTDDIMARVSPVVKATVSKLEAVIQKCRDLIEQVNQHESHVRSVCMERDQRTRTVLENTARFAANVEAECAKANTAIDMLAEAYQLEPFDTAAMNVRKLTPRG